jgi:hypothetical protein
VQLHTLNTSDRDFRDILFDARVNHKGRRCVPTVPSQWCWHFELSMVRTCNSCCHSIGMNDVRLDTCPATASSCHPADVSCFRINHIYFNTTLPILAMRQDVESERAISKTGVPVLGLSCASIFSEECNSLLSLVNEAMGWDPVDCSRRSMLVCPQIEMGFGSLE